MVIFGVVNNVSTSMMQFSFQGFPSFTNYFTTLICCAILLPFSLYKKEEVMSGKSFTWLAQKQYLILGALTVLKYSAWTYAGAWVDGNLQQVLSNLTFVFVFVLSLRILGLKIDVREGIASVVIVLGVILGMYPAIESIAKESLKDSDDDLSDDDDDSIGR